MAVYATRHSVKKPKKQHPKKNSLFGKKRERKR
jgi:hypothetical protein